jgi:methylated-DNA-[protein]-cysteine S-methyltransferase
VTAKLYYTHVDSPIGSLLVLGNGESITGLRMQKQRHFGSAVPPDCKRDDAAFARAREQLAAYFSGELRTFDLPLALIGTPFQKIVWQALIGIPFGTTQSYGELAKRIGHDGAARAVGLANGHNPIAIIVPCHRVIGADGSLTGFGGGLDRKEWLLSHEGSYRKTARSLQMQIDL